MTFDFADILLEVLERKASDLHISAGAAPTIRVRGRLQALESFPTLSPQDTQEIVYSILNDEQRTRFERDLQIDFAYMVPGVARFRVNAYRQRFALGAAFRLIPTGIPAMHTLGLPPVVDELVSKPRGLVLVTGPTGSGKSTTLASMSRSIVLAVPVVCRVPKTSVPISAAVIAREIVSRSRISPTRMTSGS